MARIAVRCTALSLLILLTAPFLSAAPAPAKRATDRAALLDELMDLIDADYMVEAVLRQVFSESMKMNSGIEKEYEASLSAEELADFRRQQEESARQQKEFMEKLMVRFDKHELVTEVIRPLFDEHFSTAQLQELVTFFKSPAGAELAQITPSLPITLMTRSMEKIQPIGEELMQEAREEERRKMPKSRLTMADMRSLATATETYGVDNNAYPDTRSLDDLAGMLAPIYIRELPREDAWGKEYTYVVSPDLQHYRFVSAGEDGRFEWDSDYALDESQLARQPRETANPDDDIIYQDGVFLQFPAEAKQEEP